MTQTMAYTDDFTKASEYLRLVLSFLSKHKVPPSPINYLIGYDFVSGTNSELKKALDELLIQAGEPSEQSLLALYKRYVAKDEKLLESVRQELLKLITTIKDEHDDSSDGLSDYLGLLSSFADNLAGSEPPEKLAAEVQTVMESTLSTELSQRKFELQMSGLMEEVDTLRKQLAQIREESLTDALTGIANRKAFDQELELLFQNSVENKSSFCVVISDIDHFKKFNDTYGHLVGDKVLRFVSSTIKSCVKGKDMAARYGGEEFTLILPDTDMSGAEVVAEQIRKAISVNTLRDKNRNEDYGKITISLGIGQFQQGESSNNLLKRADQALYRAKEKGRNRVEKAV